MRLVVSTCVEFVLVLDVITIEKTGEFFRLIYDVKGRFTIHRITAEEAKVRTMYAFYLRFKSKASSLSIRHLINCCSLQRDSSTARSK